MIRTVLFDFDGTIFDTCVGVMKSVQFALHKMGIEEEFENLYCFMGPPLVAMFMEKYGLNRKYDYVVFPGGRFRGFAPCPTLIYE